MGKNLGIITSTPQLSSDPATPDSGYSVLYVKTDNCWYAKFSDGTIKALTAPHGSIEFTPVTQATTVSAPATGNAKIYIRNKAGKKSLSIRDSGSLIRDFELQTFEATHRPMYAHGYNGTTILAYGHSQTAVGTATSRAQATTNNLTAVRRVGMVSSTTAGNSAQLRHGVNQFWRGNAAGRGGFFHVQRFGISQTQTAWRFMAGMGTQGGAGMTNADPSTQLTWAGVGKDGADTNFQLMFNDGSGTATKVNTSIAPTTTDIYELRVFCEPNGTEIIVSLEVIGGAYFQSTQTTKLIPSTTFVSPFTCINNNAQAAAVAFDFISHYVESET